MSQARTGAWWRQAHNDLELAELARRYGFHAQACFFATQAAEKPLKGAILELGGEPPHTQVLGQLVKLLTARAPQDPCNLEQWPISHSPSTNPCCSGRGRRRCARTPR